MDHLIAITIWNLVLLGALLALQPALRVIGIGPAYAMSNFDKRVEEGAVARRLAMVCANQIEATVLWVPVVILFAVLSPDAAPAQGPLTATVFLIARLAYAAVSLAGLPVLRSATWIVGFAAWGYMTWLLFAALGG